MSDPPVRDRSLLRSLLAGVLIVLFTAGATATTLFAQLNDYVPPKDPGPPIVPAKDLIPTDPGEPQTLLLLGSDRRWADKQNGDKARSDTMMLLRLNPDEDATTVMSIPRDLQVEVPGYGTEKMNNAYALGGAALTVRTIRGLTGIRVHHVVNVHFGGFTKAVNALGCFYVDVDRRYYHSNEGVPIGQRYAEIDVPAGYQRLCGQDALDYVRFRHADNDLVRAARQQDFLRSAKDQLSTSRLLGDSKKLARIFADNSETDRALSTSRGFGRLLKLGLFASDKPVRQIEFPAEFAQVPSGEGMIEVVQAAPDAVAEAVDDFMHGGAAEKADARPRSAGGARRARPTTLEGLVEAGKMVEAREVGATVRRRAKRRNRLGIPLRFPAYLTPDGRYGEQQNPRVYQLRDRAGNEHWSYRLTLAENVVEGAYYGVQGTTWRTPPLLAHPSAVRRIDGKRLELFRTGRRLRFVAWRTSAGTYWVSNTLTMKLRDDQMLALAASLTTKRRG